MDSQNIVVRLTEILTPLAKGQFVVTGDTELTGQLGMDSMQVMELIMAVEDKFDISVPIDTIAEVKTVRDFALQIQKCMGSNP